MAFKLRSPPFPPSGEIPIKHTCDGADLSPALRWSAPLGSPKSFALIMDDRDAPTGIWTHWVLYGIPATVHELPDGVPRQDMVAEVGTQGLNDFGGVGYRGPCPPRGLAHRYFFKLYALDTALTLAPRKTKLELLKAIHGHILARVELVGRYKRK